MNFAMILDHEILNHFATNIGSTSRQPHCLPLRNSNHLFGQNKVPPSYPLPPLTNSQIDSLLTIAKLKGP